MRRSKIILLSMLLGGCSYQFFGKGSLAEGTLEPLSAVIVGLSDAEVGQGVNVLAVVNTEEVASTVWNFGDGSTSSVSRATHIFSSPGIFPVTLVVKDKRGREVSVQSFVRVK